MPKTQRKRVLQRSLDDRGRCCVFLPLDETFAKLSGFPRSRGKCPKDKGGPLQDDHAKNATEKSFAKVS